MPDAISLIREDGLAILTLNRPEAGNAMNWALIDAFSAACERIAADDSVRAVLIRAEGRNFSVGGDLRAFAGEPDPAGFLHRLASRLHDGVARLAALPAPVIVAVQGAAAGAGLSLVAGADLVVASRSSTYTMAYTAIGLAADGGATWFLPRLVGLRLAQEMAFTNRGLSAEEALESGLVTRLVADDALQEEARALAVSIAQGPTRAFGHVKRLFGQTFAHDLPAQLLAEADAISAAMGTSDARNAVGAFLDRRSPQFTGR